MNKGRERRDEGEKRERSPRKVEFAETKAREGGEEDIRIMLSDPWRDINVGPLLILSSRLNSVVRPCQSSVGCIAGKDALSTPLSRLVRELRQMQHRERERYRSANIAVILVSLSPRHYLIFYLLFSVSCAGNEIIDDLLSREEVKTNPCDLFESARARGFSIATRISERWRMCDILPR